MFGLCSSGNVIAHFIDCKTTLPKYYMYMRASRRAHLMCRVLFSIFILQKKIGIFYHALYIFSTVFLSAELYICFLLYKKWGFWRSVYVFRLDGYSSSCGFSSYLTCTYCSFPSLAQQNAVSQTPKCGLQDAHIDVIVLLWNARERHIRLKKNLKRPLLLLRALFIAVWLIFVLSYLQIWNFTFKKVCNKGN